MSTLLNRRRVLGLGALGVAACGLAACSPKSSSGETLTLLLLGPSQDLISQMQDVVLPAFTKESGTKVELQTSDWGSAFQKVTTSAASNSLADVLLIGGIWTASLASKGVLMDLTDKVSSWDKSSLIYPSMLADGVYEDKNYAVPLFADIRSAIYRQDYLDQAGVSEVPTTWAEFRAAAEAMKSSGAVEYPIDWNLDNSIGIQQSFAQLFLQAGGKYWTDGKASFASEAGTKALTFMVDTYKDGLADVNMVYSGSGPTPVVSGQAGQVLQGVAVLSDARANAPEVTEHLVVGPGLKADDASTSTSVAWINKLAISKSAKNPDAAWKLLTFLAGTDQTTELIKGYKSLPARTDMAKADWLDAQEQAIAANSENTVSQPVDPRMMQLGPKVKELLEPAIRQEVGVQETLEQIDAAVDAL